MDALHSDFQARIDTLKEEVQNSEALSAYLENEEEEQYIALRDAFEPKMQAIYSDVAEQYPLQLIALERELLDSDFEGLFLPKILGYAVLRGETDKQYRYNRPQSHFKDILMTICHSSNFEYIRKRIGQTVQVGFALSSNIWVTDLLDSVSLKRVRSFLSSQYNSKYHVENERRIAYLRYKRQFKSENFYTADFPTNLKELETEFAPLYSFLKWRVFHRHGQNEQLIGRIQEMLENKDFLYTLEHLRVLGLYVYFFDLSDDQRTAMEALVSQMRKKKPEWFHENWLGFLKDIYDEGLITDDEADQRAAGVFDSSIKDDLGSYYALLEQIHTKGFTHEEVIAEVRSFYEKHPGLSVINAALRRVILNYYMRFIKNLDPQDYSAWMDITRSFPTYMDVFTNEEFNQALKYLCMEYVKKLLRTFTDKRGKDYQDIKRFVSTNFLDWNFLSQKQIKELFKTRRKKRTKTAS